MGIKFYNLDKLERAKAGLPPGASQKVILDAYVKQGGKFDGELDAPIEPAKEPAKPKGKKKK